MCASSESMRLSSPLHTSLRDVALVYLRLPRQRDILTTVVGNSVSQDTQVWIGTKGATMAASLGRTRDRTAPPARSPCINHHVLHAKPRLGLVSRHSVPDRTPIQRSFSPRRNYSPPTSRASQ